jgi:hypothetical protein
MMTTFPSRRTASGARVVLGASLAAALALGASAANAAVCTAQVCDGDTGILSTFNAATHGAAGADLDVLTAGASYDSNNVYLTATMAGAIGTTAGGFYVWGVDTGAGENFFQEEHDHEFFGGGADPVVGVGVNFDTFIVLTPGVAGGSVNHFPLGTGGSDPLGANAFTFDGDTINVVIPRNLLPGHGKDISDFGFNIWPRLGGFRNDAVTDFAPDNSNFLAVAVPEPATWAMMILGLGGIGSVLRRRRQFLAA